MCQPFKKVSIASGTLFKALLLILLSGAIVRSDDAQVSPVKVDSVPEVFDKPVPTTVDELLAMQKHVNDLVPKLMECTISIKVGRAQGSGVIISPDGYVLTAAHVSGRPGQRVTVTLADGNEYSGTTLGRNRTLDASVIKIDSDRKDWPHCEMAKVSAKPGDWCLVLAHPGGYQEDRGLVLRLGRVISENRWMIRTDCELVGGDSGGPLFGVDGKVIGINTQIGESTDFNFHVPIDAYLTDWDRMIDGEDFRTHSGAYLGVSGTTGPNDQGLLITRIYPKDPADQAGLKEGDIIVTFQNQKVTGLKQLIELVGDESPWEMVKMSVLRNGEILDVTLRLGLRLDE